MSEEKPSLVQLATSETSLTMSRPSSLRLATGPIDSHSNLFTFSADFLTPTIGQLLQKHQTANNHQQFLPININQDNKLLSDVLSQTVKSLTSDGSNDSDRISLNFALFNPSSLGSCSDKSKSFILFSPLLDGQTSTDPFGVSATSNAFILSPTRNALLVNDIKLEENAGGYTQVSSDADMQAMKMAAQSTLSLLESSQPPEIVSSTTMAPESVMCSQPAFPEDTCDSNRPTRTSSATSSSNAALKEGKCFRRSTISLEPGNQRLERKRARNRDAARKCRERKINLIKSLEKEVSELSEENQELRSKLTQTQAEVEHLKGFLKTHLESPCPILSRS